MPAKAHAAPLVEKTEEPVVEPQIGTAPTAASPFVRVDVPALWPQACVICQSAKGPLADTLHDLGRQGGRIYVCGQCAKWIAIALGFAPGERHDELLAADASLATAQQEIGNLNRQIESMLAEAAGQSRKAAALEELLQHSRDDERQRRHVLEQVSELARQALQTV